jgi:NADH-quinone oxidoreductase subunit N
MALLNKGMVALAIFAVMMSAVAAYMYLRVIMVMYMKEPEGEFEMYRPVCLCFVILLAAVATVWHGVFPRVLVELAQLASHII